MKSLYSYGNYRDYLKDCFWSEKKSSPNLTLATYARHFEMSATSLNLIFSGKRNLTVETLHQVAIQLKFSPSEREYFEALVFRDQAPKNSSLYRYYHKKMKQIMRETPLESIRVSDKALLSNWVVPVLLVYLLDFEKRGGQNSDLSDEQISAIAKQFQLNFEYTRRLTDYLKKTGLLSVDSKNQIHISFDKIAHLFPQKEFLKAIFERTAGRVDSDFNDEESIFRGYIFTVEKAAISDLKNDLKSIFETYMTKISSDMSQNTIVQAGVGVVSVLPKIPLVSKA